MTTLTGEPIAQAIREHQIHRSGLWLWADVIKELHLWVEHFDQDFELYLPMPIIAVAPLRHNVLANYRLGRSEIGARTTITFNERWLSHRSWADTLATLIHEYLHAWEEWRGGRERGGWYHSKAWRDRMAEVGIVADDHGLTQQRLPQWIAYLNQYGVSVAPLPISDASGATEAPTRSRQLAKWLCGCARARNIIRCSFELAATCNRCGQLFRQA